VSENLDLVRSIYADWERGDFRSTNWADREIEFVIAEGPARGTWTGVAEMAIAWRNFLGSWADFRAVAERYHVVDDERVLVLNHLSGSGRTSGLDVGEMRTEGAQLFHVEGGKVTRNVCYTERAAAFADLDLEE
jgi:ketosteroid isomerase-like protein